ncbi:hypothetical protein AB0C02_28225 [Micromonospora sp. NPDC048999]|uniref:hypothetical protein n=1 Tax=Micromonospora sp. NPDC048999 TaxID=3155391 RepID=UPI0033F0F359
MKLLSRAPKLTPAELAELRRIELQASIDHQRQVDQLRREQEAADRDQQRRAAREQAREEKRRRKTQAKTRARRRAQLRRIAEQARTIGPLLVVNAVTVGGQLAYVHDQTPADWNPAARIAIAIGVATAAESVALYVGWHAHDALLQRAYATAAWLRRASYAIALVMAGVNYSHFAGDALAPTALAVILGVLSSLSPWLWGLHTRRAQHVQLLREDLVDESGAQFGPARRRAFPIRSWAARRWSIDHHERDPRAAWEGYRAHRAAQRAAAPHGRFSAAWAALRGLTVEPESARVEPAKVEPAPVNPDDPEIQKCAEAREQAAAARMRVRASTWLLGLWPRAARPDSEPESQPDQGGLNPEPESEPEQPVEAESTDDASGQTEPEPEPADEQGDEQDASDSESQRGRGRRGKPVDRAQLAAAHARLIKQLDCEPKGEDLAAEAGCSKATANRWRREVSGGS